MVLPEEQQGELELVEVEQVEVVLVELLLVVVLLVTVWHQVVAASNNPPTVTVTAVAVLQVQVAR